MEIQGLAPESDFRVPRPALHPGNEVWAVSEDKRLHVVPVRVLQRVNDQAFVIGAPEDGRPVITVGIQHVSEGMVVQTGDGVAP